ARVASGGDTASSSGGRFCIRLPGCPGVLAVATSPRSSTADTFPTTLASKLLLRSEGPAHIFSPALACFADQPQVARGGFRFPRLAHRGKRVSERLLGSGLILRQHCQLHARRVVPVIGLARRDASADGIGDDRYQTPAAGVGRIL